MKIRDILTETEEKDLEKSLDSYFKRKELEKQRAVQKQRPTDTQPEEPEPTDPYRKTMRRLNAPKKPGILGTFAQGIKKGWGKGQDIKQAMEPIGRAYDKFSRHPLVRPK